MTVNPGAAMAIERVTSARSRPGTLEQTRRAYIDSYRGPQGDAPVADQRSTAPTDRSAARQRW